MDRFKTPVVPVPDWSIENYEKELADQKKHENDCDMKTHECPRETSSNRVSVINSTTTQPSKTSDGNTNNITQTPKQNGPSLLLAIPILNTENRILGEVTLTPTCSVVTPQSVNPHSSMSLNTQSCILGVVTVAPTHSTVSPQAVNSHSSMTANKQNCILGEVTLTPTHSAVTPQSVNPHSTMTANTQNRILGDVTLTPTRSAVTPQSVNPHSSVTANTQNRILGEVTLTPTHCAITPQSVNPHSSMSALTPMASGSNQAKSSIKVQNCVSTVNLGCELKLLDIYCRTRFSEYNPARFHGVVMKIIDPRATALVFRSGKVLCTGLRNEHDSYIAARKFARIIQKLGYPAKFLDFKIQNFIATADLRFPIRLEALQQAHGQFASYEPELFPGLVYRMVRPRVVLLIFVNGKIVFTGGKTRGEIHEALEIIYPILRSYRIS